jgi:hypothetical protein
MTFCLRCKGQSLHRPQTAVRTGYGGEKHHIACLGAYLKPVADQMLLVILTCSGPSRGPELVHDPPPTVG